MGYPNVIFGRYGDEKATFSSKGGLTLGQVMKLPDQREYILGKASTASAITAGVICCGSVITAAGTSVSVDGLVAATAAVGATTVVVTLAAGTAMIADQWADGYLITTSATGTGIGRLYKIKTSSSAAAASTSTITLEASDPIETLISGGTTKVGLRENLLNNVVIVPAATSLPGGYVGVTQVAVSAGYYAWFQTKGPCPAYVTTGTALVTGDQVVAATGYAGAFGPVAATSLTWSSRSKWLGEVEGLATTTGFTMVNLRL